MVKVKLRKQTYTNHALYKQTRGSYIWVVGFEFGYCFRNGRVKGGGDMVNDYRVDGFMDAELI